MAANGISTLATKQARQVAKLSLAQSNKMSDGKSQDVLDLSLLPTVYNGNTVLDNAGGLVVGRPWTSVLALFANNEAGVWFDPSSVANLNWRRNLLTYTEQFDNAVWQKLGTASVTTNTAVAPDETTTVDRLVISSGTNQGLRQDVSLAAGTYRFSLWARAVGSATTLRLASFGLDGSKVSTTALPIGNLTRYNATFTFAVGGIAQIRIDTNDVGGTIEIWGAQLEVGSTATEYQKITDLHTEVRERFPKNTLFQDVAGTQPVTTVGQTVALMLDKSKGLVLGPELVTNGDFSAGSTGWTLQTGWTISGGNASVNSAVAGSTYLRTSGYSAVSGLWYSVTFTVTAYTSGNIYAAAGTTISGTSFAAGVGTFRLLVQASGAGGVGVYASGTNTIATIDNISVKELAGNHAVQATSGQRPTYGMIPYGGVRNFANGSADGVNNAVWLLAPVANGITASKIGYGFDTDGLPYADYRFQGTATSTFSASAYQVASSRTAAAVGQTYTVSLRCQRTGGTITGVNGLRADVVEETAPTTFVGSTSSTPTTSASEVVISASRTVTSGNQMRLALVLSIINGAVIDVTYRLKALQFELGSTRTAYQFNYSKYNITETGKASVGVLFCDGIDDGMVTPSIDFSGTDKMTVWAGVQKLSDAAESMLVEMSTNSGTTAGSFALWGNQPTTTTNVRARSGGTTPITIAGPFGVSPLNGVLTFYGDIAGDNVTLLINGAQVATSSADQGTGNYSNAPLYLFRRGGTNLPFNGIFTGLIVRGAATTPTTITANNTWMNKKTGAY